MKKIILSILSLCLILVSCQNQLDINTDPDLQSPNGVAFATQLPAGILGIVGAQGSGAAIIGGMWSQYWTQGNSANQYTIIDSYELTSTDAINERSVWLNMYDALGDIRNIKRKALSEENWSYFLISTVLESYGSQILVDFYDEIPYTEANDLNILDPNSQLGSEVYDLMIQDIDLALSKGTGLSGGLAPGTDDIIFGGDMSSWIKFANTLKLKIYLRQSEARPSVASAGINSLIASGAEYLDIDAKITGFIDADSKSNPLYEYDQRQLNTDTNLKASTTMHSFLSDNADTRLPLYYGPGNPLNQGDFNSTVAPASLATILLNATTDVYFISLENSLLMQAEAMERFNAGTGAKALYDAAILENFSKYGINGSTFISTGGVYEYPTAGTMADKIESIITQKWISNFPGNGFESFFEQNRTNIPNVSPVPQSNAAYIPGQIAYSVEGATSSNAFPKRLPFSNDEINRNSNAPDLVSLTTPVWWAN